MKAKHVILFLNVMLILINTLMGAIMSVYDMSACLWADVSLMLSAALLYYLFGSNIVSGYKISMGFLLVITGAVRVVCMANIGSTLQDNMMLLLSIIIFFVEISLLGLVSYMSKK